MTKSGKLIIIGGHEDKEGDKEILQEVRQLVRNGARLVIATIATQEPEEVAQEYTAVFKGLGVKNIDILDVRTREDASKPEFVEIVEKASVIFFTGGDQLRITSQIGDTPVFTKMQERHKKGLSIVGTSAGAAAMPSTMLVYGNGDKSSRVSALGMAPGLNLIEGVVIDSHFAERGRMGRLLGAVAQNPTNLGLGIDENTAVVVESKRKFRVMGEGAVYVVDGNGMTYSSLTDRNPDAILTVCDIKLHVLGADDEFDLVERRPIVKEMQQASGSTTTDAS